MTTLSAFKNFTNDLKEQEQVMPVLFIGHGSPMNGIEDNEFTRGWQSIAAELPRPKAILAISAHWLTEGTFVHVAQKPKTIHDFWGFSKELYDLSYPCPGSPLFAEATKSALGDSVHNDLDWGIDHGTWIVLHRMYPEADIPVFQMSMDISKPSEFHYELGKQLSSLRDKGVLIMGSGNIVHNLGRIDFNENAKVFDWAQEFDDIARGYIVDKNHRGLIHYEKLGHAASLSIPTPDHYWPLLYILGLTQVGEEASFPVEGHTHGSISMRSVLIK